MSIFDNSRHKETYRKVEDRIRPAVVTTETTDGFGSDQVAYQQDWYTDEQMRSYAYEAIAWNTRAAGG